MIIEYTIILCGLAIAFCDWYTYKLTTLKQWSASIICNAIVLGAMWLVLTLLFHLFDTSGTYFIIIPCIIGWLVIAGVNRLSTFILQHLLEIIDGN